MSTKTKFRETADKAVAVAMAALLALSALTIPAPAVAATPAYESGKSATLSEKLGFDPEEFVANLEKHKDRYLGTPYTMEDREAGPGKGMDCSTFVAYALINEAGVSDSFLRYDMRPRHADDNCLPNTETLYDWAFANCDVQTFNSKEELLASEPAKGDIIFVWPKYAGSVPVGGGESHVGIYWGDGGGEDLMFHAIPPVCKIGPIEGKVTGDLFYSKVTVSHGFDLTVGKSAGDAIALDTEGNGEYAATLEGAQYGVYADEACTDKVASITISKSGSGYSGTAEGLDPGTYWVKETKAPAGYALDPEVKKVVLDDDKALSSSEDKQYATLDVCVTKVARDDKPTPEGDASFAGAKFRIDYPNGKSGIYQTNADGKVSMKVDDGAFVEGDPLDVVDGMYVLQLGTYSVTEVEAPEGCVIPEDATREIEVTATSQLTPTSTKAVFGHEYGGSLGYVQTPVLGGVMVAKGDALMFGEGDTGGDGAYYDYAQGDATLAGAEFTVYNESAERVCVDLDDDGEIAQGEVFPSGAAILTIATEYDADLDAYVARTPDRLLPYGTYRVSETKAPAGYTADGAADKEFQVREDGTVYEFLYGDGELNEVVAGGVQVIKSDLELQASEALGGNSHDAKSTGSTLSGIEFTIANASEHGVMVNGSWFHVGDDIMTVTTHWNEEAGAYTAETSADALPFGTYTIRESAANGSYLLTDGEPRTFEVREDGAVVDADTEGGLLEFSDQVVRNDLEISKKASDDNASLQVPFALTNVATGETHVIVTDRNGDFSSASSWNAHSANTNGNDRLLSLGGAVTASDMDPEAGVWFCLGEDGSEAAADDALAALPFGEYALSELRCEANEGYQLITKTIWVERDSGAAKAIWLSLDDQPGPSIQTEATDAADGDHYVACGGQVTVVDTVSYAGLAAGKEYTLHGTLMLKSTGEALVDADGQPVTAAKEFKATGEAGTVDVEFTFDASLLAGEEVVAFESLTREGAEVAAHADIDDEGQTVTFLGIRTTATDKADGDKLVTGSEVTVTDLVAYEGLTPGEAYRLTATLMDAETGEAVTEGSGLFASAVTGTAEFTAEEADGSQPVEISFDSTGLGGHRLVVFEALENSEGETVATHEDIDDEGQSVTVCEIGTTLVDASDGDHVITAGKVRLTDTVEYEGLVPGEALDKTGADLLPYAAGVIAALAAGTGCLALCVRTRRKGDGNEDDAENAENVE